jgi:hypothetical protein
MSVHAAEDSQNSYPVSLDHEWELLSTVARPGKGLDGSFSTIDWQMIPLPSVSG